MGIKKQSGLEQIAVAAFVLIMNIIGSIRSGKRSR